MATQGQEAWQLELSPLAELFLTPQYFHIIQLQQKIPRQRRICYRVSLLSDKKIFFKAIRQVLSNDRIIPYRFF
jgi:hypothetical protein